MEKEKRMYEFIGLMALKYRLSLNSIKSVFGIDLDTLKIYDNIIKYNVHGIADDMGDEFQFLFSAEVVNEKASVAALSRKNVLKYMSQYGTIIPRDYKTITKDIKEAENNQDKELLKKLKNELDAYNEFYSEEIAYSKFKDLYLKDETIKLSSGIDIITSYRLKHAISQFNICNDLQVSRKTLYFAEKKISDRVLKEKIEKLNDYILTVYSASRKK